MEHTRKIEISKRRNSSILIASIFSSQLSIASIIYNLHHISEFSFMWALIYHIFTIIAVIPQTGFSDISGRKKHLLISSTSLLFSVLYFLIVYLTKIHMNEFSYISREFITIFPICIFLGISGNSIPIARAAIADLKVHDFRTAIGWSTTFIGFGWITAIMFGLILPPAGVLITSILLQTLSIFIIKSQFTDTRDSDITNQMKSADKIIMNSYRWFISMFWVVGGTSAILAYLCSEITFYHIYSINEEGTVSISDKVTGLLMSFGYTFGVIMQWIIYCTDKKGIKMGVLISFLSIALLLALKLATSRDVEILDYNVSYILEGILNFFFSLGFGFFVPSLFSLMVTKINPHHAGRLFGAIDVTDTLALGISSFIIFIRQKIHLEDLFTYSLLTILFLASCFFYKNFVGKFSTYETLPQK